MRFFVLQNGLESLATHYFNETLGWRDVCAQQGIACRIYVNRKAGPEITGPLDAVPAFTFAADDGLRFEPVTQALHDMIVKCDYFAYECRLLDAHGVGPDDVVIAPYAGAAEMVGLARWLESHKREERPRIVTIMHRQGDDWRLDAGRTAVVEGDAAPLRYGAQRLVRAAGEDRLLFAANSTTLARLLANVTGIAVTALPVLLRHGLAASYGGQDGEAAMPAYRGHRFDVGLLGEFRAEKGGKVALKALARCFGERTGLSAAVQVADDKQAGTVRDLLQGVRGSGGIAVLKGPLSPQDFETCVGACRLIALPYHPERYAARVSGLFVEATAWGRPVVAPAGTWMSDMIDEGRAAGTCFDRLTLDAVHGALQRALDDLPGLTARSRALAPAWRQSECTEAAIARIAAWAGAA